jgi:hypothetical protein
MMGKGAPAGDGESNAAVSHSTDSGVGPIASSGLSRRVAAHASVGRTSSGARLPTGNNSPPSSSPMSGTRPPASVIWRRAVAILSASAARALSRGASLVTRASESASR